MNEIFIRVNDNKQARSGPARGLEKKKGTSIRKY